MTTPETFAGRTSRRIGAAVIAITAFCLTTAPAALAAEPAKGAKGAPIGDVIIATAVATFLSAIVLYVGLRYRAGGVGWLRDLTAFSGRVSGMKGWAALPAAVAGVALVTAVFGYYWDVAKHIDTGRDSGPFGTLAHYPILAGLGGMVLAGFLAIVLSDGETPTSVRIRDDWHAPLGGVLMLVCAAFAASGFPLDDVWHTLFGQDVTLWGPTHVLMIGGASLVVLGLWVLLIEGRRAALADGDTAEGVPPAPARLQKVIDRVPAAPRVQRTVEGLPIARWIQVSTPIAMAGAFLLAMSTLQAEFDFGVPQFQMVFHPILLMLAASVALVTARIRVGRGGAIGAVLFFLAMRGLLTLIVGPVLGESTQHFPLYIAEGAIVELVGLRFGRDRPLALGLTSGVLIGTVGLAAEWAWSHVWIPLPWPSSLFASAAIMGFAVAVAGGVLGAFIGRALIEAKPDTRPAGPSWALATAGAVVIACIAFPLPMTTGSPASATATLTEVSPAPHRTVNGTFRLLPAGAAHGAQWVQAIAWQGGGLKVDRLRRVSRGVYETTTPLPVYGNWKTVLRMENGRGLRSVPIYLPADPAIPAAGVAATTTFTRPFQRDKKLLQREAVGNSAWLTVPAYGLLVAIAAVWLAILTWGLQRLQQGRPDLAERRTAPAAAVGPPRVA
jgi:hypothetical protein